MIATIAAASTWLYYYQNPGRVHVFKDQPITFPADRLQVYLTYLSALRHLDEVFPDTRFKPTAQALEEWREWYLEKMEGYVRNLVAYNRDCPGLIVRASLIAAEKCDDPCDPVYELRSPPEQLDLFGKIFCSDKNLSSAEKQNVLRGIEKYLPPGWYRDTALATAFYSFGDKVAYDKQLSAQKEKYKRLIFTWLASYVIVLLVLLVGLTVVCISFWHIAKNRVPTNKWDSSLTFPLVYGIWLFNVYCRVLAAVGVNYSFEQLHVNYSAQLHNWLMFLICEVLSLALLLVVVRLFLVRPGHIKSIGDFLCMHSMEKRPNPQKAAFFGFCATIALLSIVSLVLAICGQYRQPDTWITRNLEALSLYPEPAAIATGVLVVVLVGPVFEELIFRGLIYRWLRKHLAPAGAIIISSFLFALVHRDPTQLIQITVIGAVLAILYERTRSLSASIALHIAYNTAVMVWLFALS